MCLYPIIIKNKKYEANKKNGGVIPAMKDEREKYVTASCGNCYECLKQKGNEWRIRLMEELKHNKEKGYFITLTFSDEALEELYQIAEEKQKPNEDIYNVIATIATRRFLERWRKEHKKSIKHWIVTELGGQTARIHLHGLIWTNENIHEKLEKTWQYGHTDIGYKCDKQTINYITKYVTKKDTHNKNYKPKILASAGIGKEFINSKQAQIIKQQNSTEYKYENGRKAQLPIYYKNKLYNESERQKQWLKKLDEETRYIMKEKIQFRTGNLKDYENFKRKLTTAQEKNTRLGYGKRKWKDDQYKQQLKKLNNGKFRTSSEG